MNYLGSFIVTFLSCCHCIHTCPGIPIKEYDALEELYNFTNGDSWLWTPEEIQWSFKSCENPCVKNWGGIVCDSNNSTILSISLISHNLTGYLPESIGNFSNLTYLDLSSNSLKGNIMPAMIPKLSILYLEENGLVLPDEGFPSVFGQMKYLTQIKLSENHMAGRGLYGKESIFENLQMLEVFYAEKNYLTGPIPLDSLVMARGLKKLNLNFNLWTGSISSTIGDFRNLTLLKIKSCTSVTGPVPAELGTLPKLGEFSISNNSLTGTIPDALSALTQITYMSFRMNRLTGTIPSWLGRMKFLYQFETWNNSMNGTIPPELGGAISLQTLIIHNNFYTGSIPSTLGYLNQSTGFYFFNNRLTGTLPNTFSNLSKLATYDVGGNLLHGTIPENTVKLTSLSELVLNNNAFTGTIPAQIGNLKSLRTLNLNENNLGGTIPASLVGCEKLLNLYLYRNNFEGSLDNVFVEDVFSQLLTIDISDNSFSGPFPYNLLANPNIVAIYASKNCFSSLSLNSACQSTTLETLVLDGLSGSEGCRGRVDFPNGNYVTNYDVRSSIPSCIFSVSKIQTLQLKGIGLEGLLESDILLSETMTTLLLNHNRIRGVLPNSFMESRTLEELTMDHNRISGVWNVLDTQPTMTLSLSSNRLSGPTPSSADRLSDVDVLKGNRFACSENVAHDTHKDSAPCGSENLDTSLETWISVIGFFFLCMVCYLIFVFLQRQRFKQTAIIENSKGYFETFRNLFRKLLVFNPIDIFIPDGFTIANHSRLRNFLKFYGRLVQLVFTLSVVVTIVFGIFIYIPMRNQGYDTHAWLYSYLCSAAYFEGFEPAIAILLPFYAITLILLVLNRKYVLNPVGSGEIPSRMTILKTLGPVFVINAGVTTTMSVIYVMTQVGNFSTSLKIVFQFLYSGFSLMWDHAVIPCVLRYLRVDPITQFYGRLTTKVYNLLFSSALSTALADPMCYSELLNPPTSSTSEHYISECLSSTYSNLVVTCNEYGTIGPFITSFNAPFVYSHSCYSAIVVNFAPIIVYQYLFRSIAIPLTLILPAKVKWITEIPFFGHIIRSMSPQILWAADFEVYRPLIHESYLKIPKYTSNLFFIMCVVLTFGVVCPPVIWSVVVAQIFEVASIGYFFRRFMISSVKAKMYIGKDGMRKEDCHRVTWIEVLTWPPSTAALHDLGSSSRGPTSTDNIEDASSGTNPRSSTASNSLTEVESTIENECGTMQLVFSRPCALILVFCGMFIGGCTLDMSAVGFNTWPQFVWMPILSVSLPLAFMYHAEAIHIRRDTLRALDQTHHTAEEEVELSNRKLVSNPILKDEVETS